METAYENLYINNPDNETYDNSFLEDRARSDQSPVIVKNVSSLNMEIRREQVKNAIFYRS